MTNKHNCPAKDWTCYFAPLTHCTLPAEWEQQSAPLSIVHLTEGAPTLIHSPVRTHLADRKLFVNKSTVEGLNSNVYVGKPSSWWMAHATAYMARPNKRTLNVACLLVYWNCVTNSATEPDRPMASVFVRSGDKWKEAKFRNTFVHMKELDDFVAKHPNLRPNYVYFGTDNSKILTEAALEFGNTWNLSWFGYHRSDGGMTHEQRLQRSRSGQIELQTLMTRNRSDTISLRGHIRRNAVKQP